MTRSRLPNKRYAETVSFTHENMDYTATFGWTESSLAELFLDGGKTGSSVNIMAKEAAVILSIALQHGTPLTVIRDALPKLQDGLAAGPVGTALSLMGPKQEG